MDPLLMNGPHNYGTHWGIDPYAHTWGVEPYWNPYHGSQTLAGLGDPADPAASGAADLGNTSVLHILVAAGFDGVTGLTGGKPALGMALLAVGALGIFAAYTSARSWNHRHVRRHGGAS